ncbi:MAG: thiol peroxidase [Candidatus Omnitrophica bacterium]|nr:thiol peroxidase [Candidatus Omnitrophota bacterium]
MKKRQTTFKGKPLDLAGGEIGGGQKIPEGTLWNKDLEGIKTHQWSGKTRIIATLPSVDTSVCACEARALAERASELSGEVDFIAVSMDLPFAQQRFRESAGLESVHFLSDHKTGAFGQKLGVLINDLRLLSRAVFVVDRGDVVRHVEYVKEMTDQPDYTALYAALQSASGV